MTVHNLEGVKQVQSLGFSRCVLSRELTFQEIENIKKNTDIELEVFVHGALCISYSGQCLLSSMIGGRSGNRGLCAQPCRLPYELHSEKEVLDKGYLLSPRDLCSIELLPELIKAGIDSFKIEGRMKTPTYVATVTKIYRKYIDLISQNIDLDNNSLRDLINKKLNEKNKNTILSDKEELMQVFNRGEFSKGHLSEKENRNLIFKEKPNNMGLYLGEVYTFNQNKGHISLKLQNKLSVGDKISINSNSYTVSELMINNKNFTTVNSGEIVKIGRMKGNINFKDKIYKIEDINLNKASLPTFSENKEFKKIKINGDILVKKNAPIIFKVFGKDGFYKEVSYEKTLDMFPEEAINKPISKEKILDQLSKTGSTEFEFENINVILEDGLFIPKISILNELRREVLAGLENEVMKKYTHNISKKSINYEIPTNLSPAPNKKNISLLLNTLNLNMNYLDIQNANKLYIPLKYFYNNEYFELLKKLGDNFNLYVYMPIILRDLPSKENLYSSKLKNIVDNFSIKGFVISHISELEFLKAFNLEIISNYSLNVFNNISINMLKEKNISTITLSPELTKNEILNIETNLTNSNIQNLELIVYGNLPVMTNSYCYLGKSNKCYKECDKKCLKNDKYYLKDRMGFEFRILPDNLFSITTIYNSKITSINPSDLSLNNYRIDILDENIEDINSVIQTYLNGKRIDGKDYTNGAF